MSRATEELLDSLHGLQARALIDEINAYRDGERFHPPKYDKEGNQLPPEPMALPASVMAAAIKFLKDNGIDRPGRSKDTVDELDKILPDMDNVTEFPRS